MTKAIFAVALIPLFIVNPAPEAVQGNPALALSPTHLRCEFTENPMGVDIARQRLYWYVESSRRNQKQTAYQILAASTSDLLAGNTGDLWDSGKVDSDQTAHVPYQGKSLTSSQQVFWKVRVWDTAGQPSEWSAPAKWTMGLLRRSDWKGQWIVAPWVSETQLFRKEFAVESKVKRALVYICGLGQYELFINGEKAGKNLISPGWTKYDKTCLYDSFDVTASLKQGNNAIGLALGDGMYHTERRDRFSKFQGTFGPKRAIGQIQIEYEDGTCDIVGTDNTWRVHTGPVTFNDIYGGEDYDARRAQKNWNLPGFYDLEWDTARLLVRPQGTLRSLSCAAPPLQAIETIQPVGINDLPDNMQVVDFGQNTSYMPRIRVSGPAGSTVRLTHAEVLFPDGMINRGTCGGNRGPAYWQYTKATDNEETWFPQFFYVGCRYLQVERFPAKPDGPLPKLEKIEGVVVHSIADPLGSFDCSNPLLGRIRNLVRWAQRSNMVSVLTDCPHREKLGWLEQYHLNGPAFRYEYDVTRIFIKGMNDMADSQLQNGLVPNIAPEYVQFNGTFRAAAEWAASFIMVPWQHYLWTGDTDLFEQYFPAMKRYLAYLDSRAEDYILDEGLGDWYDVGPRKSSRAELTPPEVTASAFYYYDHKLVARIAKILGEDEDARLYEQKAAKIRQAYHDRFFHADTNHELAGQFGTGSQCSNALALVMDLAEPSERGTVLDALVRDVKQRGNAVTAGDVGFRYLLLALAQGNRSDVIYDMINQDDKPGYGYMLKMGETSLTEAWDANHGSSHNHFMLGQITEWFYRYLVGIDSDPNRPGFKNIIIRPQPVGELKWAEGTYESIHGPISARWEREGGKFSLNVTIPANTTATIWVPARQASEVTESGRKPAEQQGINFVRAQGDRRIYQIGSGSYKFESQF
ncbi:MAG: family 78 glycoside hydrolase catalytic domain [Sedimentisphaerales bacterium]|nr:family 78 glycoside hydrolase catalytic domain [Sedimentisphaerales bacterium]